MKERSEKWVHIASIVLAVLTAVVAVLFIWQTLHLYLTGIAPENQIAPGVYLQQIYSLDTISAHFAPIAPVVYIWLAFCAALGIARIFVPAKEKPVVDGLKQWREQELRREEAAKARKPVNQRLIALAGLAIAAVLVIIGCFNGSLKDVFVKAINICTECVGLG